MDYYQHFFVITIVLLVQYILDCLVTNIPFKKMKRHPSIIKLCICYTFNKNWLCLQDSEKMFLKAIEIKKSILDENDAEIAFSLNYLGRFYLKIKKLKESEEVLLQSSNICKLLNIKPNHKLY